MTAQVVSIDMQTLIEGLAFYTSALFTVFMLYVSARVKRAKLEVYVSILKKDVVNLGGIKRHYMEDQNGSN